MYKITVRELKCDAPSVAVAEVKDVDGAISYGFQLHNMTNLPHEIFVYSPDGSELASFTRLDKIAFPDKVNK